MSSDRWHQAWSLFQAALELPVAERDAFLNSEAAEDEDLRRAVGHWLEADSEATGFLEGGVLGSPVFPPLDLTGRQIGSYAVQEEIGHGGMGTVYLAQQKDEIFDRKVALKILTTAPFGREARRRFEFERKALASLDHSAIARVFDGGTTEEDVPYLVLEYVPGEGIDRYCDARKLTVRERVALFRTVCQAVATAHRALIVHRDLKPSNILVREDGQPKLLDFGIAKLVTGEADPTSALSWSRPLTPRYASPEQIRGERASISTDIFSLGVLLYQLLCGSLPFETGSEDLNRLLEEIERGPQAPSARALKASYLSKQLRGDLDSIVLKALRPEVSERYSSVDQLDEDLERYLSNQPVRARQGSRRYRSAKFLRRNRWPAALAATLIVGVAALVAVLWLSNVRLSSERAEQEEVVNFFLEVFEGADPLISGVADETVKQAIDRGAGRLKKGLHAQPGVRAALASVLGEIYLDLGDPEAALEWAQEAWDRHSSLEGPESLSAAKSLSQMGAALAGLERLDDSLDVTAEALARLRKAPGATTQHLIHGMNIQVNIYCARGDLALAAPLAAEALALARADLPARDPETLTAVLMQARVLGDQGNHEGAIKFYDEAKTLLEEFHGLGLADAPVVFNNLGSHLASLGRHAEAQEQFEESDRIYQTFFGKDYFERAKPLSALGRYARSAGDTQRALDFYGEAVRIGRLSTATMHIVRPVPVFADLLIRQGECERAEAEILASLARLPKSSERPLRVAVVECLLGASLACQERDAEAQPILQRSLEEITAAGAKFPELCREALAPLVSSG